MDDEHFTVSDWLLYIALVLVSAAVLTLFTLLLFPETGYELWRLINTKELR